MLYECCKWVYSRNLSKSLQRKSLKKLIHQEIEWYATYVMKLSQPNLCCRERTNLSEPAPFWGLWCHLKIFSESSAFGLLWTIQQTAKPLRIVTSHLVLSLRRNRVLSCFWRGYTALKPLTCFSDCWKKRSFQTWGLQPCLIKYVRSDILLNWYSQNACQHFPSNRHIWRMSTFGMRSHILSQQHQAISCWSKELFLYSWTRQMEVSQRWH